MKAGVAAMASAAGAVARSKVALRGDLIVAGVVGELQGGIGTTHHLKQGLVPDYAIVPEPTLLNIRTLHAGLVQFLVSVRGKACWAGSVHIYPHVNAVEKICKVIEALRNISISAAPHPEIPHLPRKHIGNLIGALTKDYLLWRPSYVPDYATVVFEVRTVPGQTVEDILADLHRVLDPLQAEDPELDIEIEPPPAAYREPWRGMIEMPPLELPKDDPLVGMVHRHHVAVLGNEPERIGFVDPGSYAGADSGHLQQAGAHVLNYGPTGHSFWEHSVEIEKLVNCARVLALVAEEVLTSSFDQLPGNTFKDDPPSRKE
jgi:acetylornithine deacetylase/succinyl-diaminopimelate desuccinylase-like protein